MVAEAQRQNVALSEIERKMLYFSESGRTLPDLTSVHEEFDRQYEQDEYEQKIAGLIRKADKHARKESRDEYEAWWAAARFLKDKRGALHFGNDWDCRYSTCRRSMETS